MSRGFCLLAQNNDTTDYVRQAYALAVSLHKHNVGQKISLITKSLMGGPLVVKLQGTLIALRKELADLIDV